MLAYQRTLYGLIEQVGIGDETLKQESYKDLEQSFLDRRTTMLVAQLPEEDQKLILTKMAQWAGVDEVYEFLDASLPNIDQLNQQILDDFANQYRDSMWL